MIDTANHGPLSPAAETLAQAAGAPGVPAQPWQQPQHLIGFEAAAPFPCEAGQGLKQQGLGYFINL